MAGNKETPLLVSHDTSRESSARQHGRGRRALAWTLASMVGIGFLMSHAPLSRICHGHMPGWLGRGSGGLTPALASEECPQVEPLQPSHRTPELDAMDARILSASYRNVSVGHLASAVRIRTESYDDLPPVSSGDPRWDAMGVLAQHLSHDFPAIHATLQLEKINTFGLLFTWPGTDPDLKPTVLMAHQDVVPVAPETASEWTHPPYSGHYDGHYVWGRGALDCKNMLVGILEAVELLVGAGFAPRRTLVLSFGFDEEISGREGAGHLSRHLLDRYGKQGVAAIVDEGSPIGSAWGSLFAVPGTTEKGYIDVEIVVRMPGGHSSIPPPHSGIGIMSELVTVIEANRYEPRLHDGNPYMERMQCGAAYGKDFPDRLRELLPKPGKRNGEKKTPKKQTKDRLAEEAAKESDLVKYLFTTSVAVDVIGGGVKVNALPERTRAVVNHRVNVGEHTSDVVAKLTGLAARVADRYNLTLHAFDDESGKDDTGEEEPSSITLRSTGHDLEPAPVTPTEARTDTPYGVLSGTTRWLYGEDVYVAPGLMTGNTDTRFYWDLSKHIFRFMPGFDPDEDIWLGIHTVDEKASMLGHVRGVQWYSRFIRNMDEANLE